MMQRDSFHICKVNIQQYDVKRKEFQTKLSIFVLLNTGIVVDRNCFCNF